MRSKKLWRALFLGATGTVIGLELLAACDDSSVTEPWTDMVVAYIPAEVATMLYGGLVGWLLIHFWMAYRRKRKK